jgi:hypothetical protein
MEQWRAGTTSAILGSSFAQPPSRARGCTVPRGGGSQGGQKEIPAPLFRRPPRAAMPFCPCGEIVTPGKTCATCGPAANADDMAVSRAAADLRGLQVADTSKAAALVRELARNIEKSKDAPPSLRPRRQRHVHPHITPP